MDYHSPATRHPGESSLSSANQPVHRFSFTGNASEYFRIWIVNIALTILTLGIYAAWAKVRREQYFHSHTYFAGSSFEYTADPKKILKGRLLIVAFVVVLAVLQAIAPLAQFVLICLGAIAAPWVVNQALRFRTRYTTYRNISFHFVGNYWDAVRYLFVARIIGLITLGILLPWSKHRERRYVISGLRYGKGPFSFIASAWDFVPAYRKTITFVLIVVGVPTLLFALNSFITIFFAPANSGDASTYLISSGIGAGFIFVMILGGLLATITTPQLLRVLIAIATWNHTALGNFRFQYEVRPGRYVYIVLTNLLLKSLSLGLATPYCVVRMHRYKVENLALVGPDSLNGFFASTEKELHAVGDQAADLYDIDIDFGF